MVLRGESGILKIPFKKLPESLQKEYGFDPQKASETASPAAGTTSDTSGTFSETRSPLLPSLTEIEPFFQQFIDRGHPTPRDQFETQEEYSARLPKDLDSTIIYYFVVKGAAAFQYDIDRQRLLISAGEFEVPRYNNYSIGIMVPVKIFGCLQDKGDYEGSNSYGKTATVTKANSYDYFFHLTNGKALSSKLRIKSKDYSDVESLGLSFPIATADAKKLAPDLVLVCGVRFLDYKRSIYECTGVHKPTVDNPSEFCFYSKGIDAEIASLSVVNTQTMEEFARWTK